MDPSFLGENIYAVLARYNNMKEITQLIKNHIADLEALELSENKLHSLDSMEALTEAAPNVKTLYLTNNKVCPFSEI